MSFRKLFLCCAVAFCAAAPIRAAAAQPADADFLQSAIQTEVGQYDLGLIGARKASAPAAKDLGNRLSGEASAAVAELKNIARAQSLPYKEDAELRAKAQYQDLEGRSGSDFDRTLAHDAMIDANIALDDFIDEAQHGTDPALRRFAAAQLPKLRADAKMGRDLGG